MARQSFNYRKLGYVAMNVGDLKRSVDFYRDVVGLDVTDASNNSAFVRCSDSPHDLIFSKGDQVGIKRIAFEMESDADLEKAEAKLKDLGVPVIQVSKTESDDLRIGRALRFGVPTNGVALELYSGVKKVEQPYKPTLAHILRLGHVVIGVKNFDATAQWLMNNFGFEASDYIIGVFAFLRCYPNPYHHSLGLGNANENKMHHIAFMVDNINDIGAATNRLKKAGAKVVFGPGRHVASGSIFLYFLDPDGLTIEYTLGMEEFDAHTPRDARQLVPGLETVDMWGGAPDPQFANAGIVEELRG